MKGLVLGNHSSGISMTWVNSRIYKKGFCEAAVLMVFQKPEALNQQHIPRGTFASEGVWTKENTAQYTAAP